MMQCCINNAIVWYNMEADAFLMIQQRVPHVLSSWVVHKSFFILLYLSLRLLCSVFLTINIHSSQHQVTY